MKPAKPPNPQSPPPESGLRCRDCGCRDLRVIYVRRALGGRTMRRRECRNCCKRVTPSEGEK